MKVRTGAKVAVVALLAAGLAGCSLLMTPQTQYAYDASDGVRVAVGDVRLLNMIVFTEDGEDGNFTAAAVNSSDDDVDLTLQYVSGGDKVDVELTLPAGTTFRLGSGDGEQILLPGIDTPAGSLLTIYVQYGAEPGKQVPVPVLDAALEQYEGLLPMPVPTPTLTATPEPVETPAP